MQSLKMQQCKRPVVCVSRSKRAVILRPVMASPTSSSNGNSSHATPVAGTPSAAETARTIVDIVREGTLATISEHGIPIGSPVSFTLDKQGAAWINLSAGAPELHNLRSNPKCSLMVQPTAFPARAVASVTLVGSISSDAPSETSSYRLELDKALYYGGLDHSSQVQEVTADAFLSSEPDVLRTAADDLVKLWNEERAEDIYLIVSHLMHVPISEMIYAELLWVDRLGMYVRSEIQGRQPEIVRVPFYRSILDERDARSVITMAAQIAWEADRPYTPTAPLQANPVNN